VAQFLETFLKKIFGPTESIPWALFFRNFKAQGLHPLGHSINSNTVHMFPGAFMPISRQKITGRNLAEIPKNFLWYHVVLTTYGHWLPGNQQGFRTRHHRQHIEGDYKNPPREDYSGLHAKSAAQMAYPMARMPHDYREIVGLALVERLHRLGGFVLTAAVSKAHIHMLVKLPSQETRRWIGLSKKHAWFEIRELGWKEKLWAKRGKIQPIHNKKHQQNCFAYILRHIHEGAWVWVNDCMVDSVIERIIRNK
jgi:hypothetical protein